MIEELKAFTETIVKSLVSEPDLVEVQNFQDEEENPIIEIMVSDNDMGKVIKPKGWQDPHKKLELTIKNMKNK